MPKVISLQALGRLVDLIAKYPDGIGIEVLAQTPGVSMPRRTIQRRLATLIEQKRIICAGAGRARKYQLAPNTGVIDLALPAISMQATGEVYFPSPRKAKRSKSTCANRANNGDRLATRTSFLSNTTPTKTPICRNRYGPNCTAWAVHPPSKGRPAPLPATF